MGRQDPTVDDWIRLEWLKVSLDIADTSKLMNIETAQILEEADKTGMIFSGNTAQKIVKARVHHLESLIKRTVDARRQGIRLCPELASKDQLEWLRTHLLSVIEAQESGIPHRILERLNLKGWDRLPAQFPARLRDLVLIEFKKLELESKLVKPTAESPSIQQTVFGNVGQMVGGNITANVTVVALLGAVEKAIRESAEIPAEEKDSLISKLRELSTNPWIVSLGAGGLFEILKGLL